jgi:hypothetical protein
MREAALNEVQSGGIFISIVDFEESDFIAPRIERSIVHRHWRTYSSRCWS